jgi:hypothetical protein
VLQHIDVEAFELKSQPFRVFSYSPPIITGQTGQLSTNEISCLFHDYILEVRLNLPFHLRYHEAGRNNREVVLVQPSLLASCPYQPGEAVQNCPGWSEGPAPCIHCSHELCDWTHLPYSSVIDNYYFWVKLLIIYFQNELDVSLSIPVGNSDHGALVMIVTAFTMIVATIFLLYTIQKSAKKNK